MHCKPIVREASDDSSALKVDLAVRGVWQPQCDALFDIRLVDTDAPSYRSHASPDVLRSAESDEKKNIYRPAKIVELLLPHFVFLLMAYWEKKRIFSSIVYLIFCVINGRKLSIVMNWIRARLSFAILRATLLWAWIAH